MVIMFNRPAYTIFIINACIFFFQALTKSVYAPLIVPFREAFMIDNAQAGFLVALVFLGYAIARFPSGIMADKWSCTKVIWAGSLAMALSFWTVAFSPNYYSIAFFTFTLGVSSGLYVTAGYTLAEKSLFPWKLQPAKICKKIIMTVSILLQMLKGLKICSKN
jgi:predicted MFS family arabinose efflux permease